jgi:hypothetical protein
MVNDDDDDDEDDDDGWYPDLASSLLRSMPTNLNKKV